MEDNLTYEDYDINIAPANYLSPVELAGVVISLITIIVGCTASLLAAVIIIKRRLWIQHEGYFYLAAIFITNAFIIVFHFIPVWFSMLDGNHNLYELNNFTCKFMVYVHGADGISGWQMVAFLFGVFFRRRLAPTGGGSCCNCPSFAGKFCTLKTAKIITVTMACLFAVGNLWKLWAMHIETHTYNRRAYRYCTVDDNWGTVYHVWNMITAIACWLVPLALLLVLVIMIACTRRRSNSGIIPYQEMDEGDERRNLDREYFRISICLGIFSFISELLHGFLFADVLRLYLFSMMSQTIVFAILPILCLALLTQLREELPSKCCRESSSHKDEGDRTNILELGTTKKTYDSASQAK